MSERKRRVCVVLVDRANYGRLKPVMAAIRERPELELQVLCAGTMVLERFDQPVKVVRADGFTVDGEIFTELEGSTPVTMAKSVGFGVVEFASEFQRLKPDVVLLIGDRYEALAAALAAAYMNLTIVHMQGGEISGSIDESARHCITKLAQFHFPPTARAKHSPISATTSTPPPPAWRARPASCRSARCSATPSPASSKGSATPFRT